MKRFSILFLVTLLTFHFSLFTSTATTYSGQLMLVVNGATGVQPADIDVVKQDNGLYTLSLRNFVLSMGGNEMPVGNITLSDIEALPPQGGQEGGLTFQVEQDVNITDGDREDVAMWFGPAFGAVPIALSATLSPEKVHAVIDLTFAPLNQTIKVIFDNSITQIPNSDFELFHKESMKTGIFITTTITEDEADHWHSFLSGTGSLISIAATKHTEISTDVRPGSEGSKSLLVKAGNVMGIVANGTVTTGRLNAGDMSAESKLNCAFIDMSNTETDAHGDPFYTRLNALPDSLVVWVKFNQKKAIAKHPYATLSATITDGTYYQDPEDKDYTNVVARAANREIASTNTWQRISVPFIYTENNVDPRCILVTLSTNADAGQGNEGDELYVDDLSLVYNHRLTSLKIKGVNVPDFSPDNLEYNMEVSGDVTEDDIKATVDGKDAATSIAIVGDEEEGVRALVTVIAADLTTATTYVVNLTTSTGINSVHSSESIVHSSLISHPSSVYDLQGRKIADNYSSFINHYSFAKRGIYIVNGKKIVIR